MELVFITRAIRRFWWVVVVGGVLGLLGGVVAMDGGPDVYESNAMILVSPVTEWGASATSTDRFVQNQVSLLSSSTLAERVAAEIDVDEALVVHATTFEQVAGTDVIRVSVRSESPELSQSIANRYVDAYLESVREQAAAARAPDLDDLDERLQDLEGQIEDVDALIQSAMEPYLPGGSIAGPDPQIVPSIVEIDPALATRREVAIQQYSDLLAQRNTMTLGGAQARSGTQVWQRADLPPAATPGDRPLMLFAGPLLGLMVGCLAAVGLARASDRVLDADEVSEVLGVPVTGRAVVRASDAAAVLATRVPQEIAGVTHHLCVRSEASGSSGRALVVVVAGAQGAAGTDVVAAAMSRAFAEAGARTVMLAAGGRPSAQMSEIFGEDVDNIGLLVQLDQSPGVASRSREQLRVLEVGDPAVRFAGPGPGSDGSDLRRQDVASLLHAASLGADVVIVDAGDLMASAASVRLAQSADVVVLAVPVGRQQRVALSDVAREVRELGTVLPVMTRVRSRSSHDGGTTGAGPDGQRWSVRTVTDLPEARDEGDDADEARPGARHQARTRTP